MLCYTGGGLALDLALERPGLGLGLGLDTNGLINITEFFRTSDPLDQ